LGDGLSVALPPEVSMRVRPVSQLAPRPVAWLWAGRLALGKLAILDGDPGLGKSLVMLDLCARLTSGRPFPDGSPGPGPASAIILNGEDGEEDTLLPRLQALGADLERVFVFHPDGPDAGEPLRIPANLGLLDDALAQTRARLVVIDPIVAFLDPGILSSSDQSVRRALLPLARLADRHQCAIQLVRHLNKSGGRRALYRGGGSIGFLAACRSGWLIARDPQDPRRRILAQVKNNLAPAQPSLAFTVEPQDGAPPTLSWMGPCAWTADQLLAEAAAAPPPASPRDRAREFLAALLEKGPHTSRDIWQAAQEQGLAERTLLRAKRQLGIRSVRVHVGGPQLSYWLLPGQQLPASVPPDAAPPDLEPWLKPLREQYPPSTPLDED
jgi:hypothetical protein